MDIQLTFNFLATMMCAKTSGWMRGSHAQVTISVQTRAGFEWPDTVLVVLVSNMSWTDQNSDIACLPTLSTCWWWPDISVLFICFLFNPFDSPLVMFLSLTWLCLCVCMRTGGSYTHQSTRQVCMRVREQLNERLSVCKCMPIHVHISESWGWKETQSICMKTCM